MTRRLFYFLGQLWLCLKKTIFEYFRVQNWHVSYFLFYCFVLLDSFTIKSFYPVTLVSFKIYECFVYDASKYFYVTHKILCEGCFFCAAFFSRYFFPLHGNGLSFENKKKRIWLIQYRIHTSPFSYPELYIRTCTEKNCKPRGQNKIYYISKASNF